MATTTNYSWTTPDDTALVKDGAAAIRSLGTAIDTTTKNLNPSTTLGDIEYRSSTANTNTRLGIGTSGQSLTVVAGVPSWAASPTSVLTTTGDTLYASAANTLSRLGIGSTGQILTVSGGVPAWAAAPTSAANWSLLNSGGTALTGAQTITISGISGKDKIMILVAAARSASASRFSFRLNTDTGSNYYRYGQLNEVTGTYSSDYIQRVGAASTGIDIALGGAASAAASGYCILTGCNTAGVKQFNSVGAINYVSGTNQNYNLGGYYDSSSTISSISVFSETGNFNNGTVYVYTSA